MEENNTQHDKIDEQLQKRQNNLIERNTRITIWLGVGAIVAQLLDTVIQLLK